MRIAICHHCAKPFKFRANKRFCSDACRYASHETSLEPCYYCGCPASDMDHVPPRAYRGVILDLRNAGHQEFSAPFAEVPACRECNSVLSAAKLWTLAERKEYMKQWIRRRYKKYLNCPKWSPEELEKISDPRDREFMLQGYAISELTRRRLDW